MAEENDNNNYAENNVWTVDTEAFEPVKIISDRDEAYQRFNKLFRLFNRCEELRQSIRNLKRQRDQAVKATNRQRINQQIRDAEAEIAERCGDIEARLAEARAALAAFPPTGVSNMKAFNKPVKTGGTRRKMSKGQASFLAKRTKRRSRRN